MINAAKHCAYIFAFMSVSCGIQLNSPKQQDQLIATNTVMKSKVDSDKITDISENYRGFNFSTSNLFETVSSNKDKLLYIGKFAPTQTILSLKDGTFFVYNDATRQLEAFSVSADPNANQRRIVFPSGIAWHLSESSLSRVEPKASESSSGATTPQQTISKISGDASKYTILFADEYRLILRSIDGVSLITFKGGSFETNSIQSNSAIATVANKAIAAGITPSNKTIWFATEKNVHFFEKKDSVVNDRAKTVELELGMKGSQIPLMLALSFDNELKVHGSAIMLTQSDIFLSSQLAKRLTWEADIKPLASAFCIGCHSSPVGSFASAQSEAHWLASKDKIVERLASTANPMPPKYSNLNLTEENKQTIKNWLSQGNENSTTSSTGTAPSTQPVAVALSPIAPSFGQSPILQGIQQNVSSINFISKYSTNQTIFSMFDGTAYLYDEILDTVNVIQSPIAPTAGVKYYLVGNAAGWSVSTDKIESFSPSTDASAEGQTLSVLSTNFNSAGYSVIHASAKSLILKSSTTISFLERIGDSLNREDLDTSLLPELNSLLLDIKSAGYAPDQTTFCFASSNKVLFFEKTSSGFKSNPSVASFYTGLPAGVSPSQISLSCDRDKKIVGKIIFVAGGKIYVSGLKAAAVPLSWEIDIRPIAEQYCLSCHGAQGAGGFSNADQSISWTGVKRESIIARVFSQKTMPPLGTEFAKTMSDEKRSKIRMWLTSGELPASPTSSPTATASATPTTGVTLPSPGPTWTNVVQPILQTRCSRCHTTYSTFESAYNDKAKIIQRIENGTMPQAGSAERSAFIQTEKDSILSYLKAFP